MVKGLFLNSTQLLNGQPGRVHHAHVREQTNKMKCSLKVSGKDNHSCSQQTMIDEQYIMVWLRTGGCSISTRRNGSLTVRWEKLAGIKKCQIENTYISESWQPHSLSQIGHKFMIFHNCSCFDTSYFNLGNEWEKSMHAKKKGLRCSHVKNLL